MSSPKKFSESPKKVNSPYREQSPNRQIIQKEVDQNLYSRQIGVIGLETQSKLAKQRIFIHGLRGTGIEIAKNLILAGPGSLVLHDNGIVTLRDLGCNFTLEEGSVGKITRSEASVEFLKNLNEYVKVEIYQKEVTTAYLQNFDIVVFTDFYDIDRLIIYNKFCRENKIGFIYAGLLGLYGYAFVDYGSEFTINDDNGEPLKNSIVTGITQDENAIVELLENSIHNFSIDDYVTFKELEGMEELNGQTYQIKGLIGKNSLVLDVDSRYFNAYGRGGIIEQVKVPKRKVFNSLEHCLLNPIPHGKDTEEYFDASKSNNFEHLHLTLLGLYEYYRNYKSLPQLNDENDAEILLRFVNKIIEHLKSQHEKTSVSVKKADKDIVFNVSNFARAQITTSASFLGGIVAQEIIKFTGKFTPIYQWLHFDTFESLPEFIVNKHSEGSRYDDFISIYGSEILEKIQSKRLFVIGAGALGCEFLKTFALLGISTQQSGCIHVTDDDNIEMSNLNRQFLFQKKHIGQSKSKTASSIIIQMNKNMRIKTYTDKVCPETENTFNDEFWENIDYVVTAVDNVNARIFLNSRCIFYEKIMLECGTLGTKCHSEVIIPFKTQTYSDLKQPTEESSIPLCTLKNFPYQIEHTIQWARDFFEGEFVEGSTESEKFVEDHKKYLNHIMKELKDKSGILRKRLEIITKIIKGFEIQNFDYCIELARLLYEELFVNNIVQLIHSLPLNHKTEGGNLFWSGSKRPPQLVPYNSEDPLCLDFVNSAANLYAFVFGIENCKDLEYIRKKSDLINIPKFQVKVVDSKKLEENKEEENKGEDDEEVIKTLHKNLEKFSHNKKHKLRNIVFEKDNDSNFHIDFLAATSNLRARNYKIQEETRLNIKIIVGKIIPAMATTTAMIVGTVGNEIIKLSQNKDISFIKNAFMNLAIPSWLFIEPNNPIKNKDKDYDEVALSEIKCIPSGFTSWDKIEVSNCKTLHDVFELIKKNYDVDLDYCSAGLLNLYSITGIQEHDKKCKERLKKPLVEVWEELSQTKIPKFRKYLELEISGDVINKHGKNVQAKMPTIKYHIIHSK